MTLEGDELNWLYGQLRKINEMHARAQRDHVAVLGTNNEDHTVYEAVVLTLAIEGMLRRRNDLLARINDLENDLERED